MNTYMKLKFHHERNIFKRGQFKGDAPAGKRWRTWVRVVKHPAVDGNDDSMRVRMYGTDLLTAYPDGRVVIDTGGWYDRPTTRLRINEAFGFMPFNARLSSRKVFGLSQPVLRVGNKMVLYYDGIELSAEGTITSPLRHFERKQVNKAESKEIRDDMAAFKEAFNLLWAVSTPDNVEFHVPRIREAVTKEYQSNLWPAVIAKHTWYRYYNYHIGRYEQQKREAPEVWASIMQQLRKDCYEVVKTEITTL
jgi:hypothetical protein